MRSPLRIEEWTVIGLMAATMLCFSVHDMPFRAMPEVGIVSLFFFDFYPIILVCGLLVIYRRVRLGDEWPSPFTGRQAVGEFLRIVWPFIVSQIAYANVKAYVPVFNPKTYDAQLIEIDKWTGGAWLCETLIGLRNSGWEGFFDWFYLHFFAAVVFVLVLLCALGKWTLARRYSFAFILGSAIGMFFYVLTPAVGPCFLTEPSVAQDTTSTLKTSAHWQVVLWEERARMMAAPESYKLSPFIHIAAFPSLHVAHTVPAAWFSWKYARPFSYVIIPGVLINWLATMALEWHYAIDVWAGLVVGALAIVLANKWVKAPA